MPLGILMIPLGLVCFALLDILRITLQSPLTSVISSTYQFTTRLVPTQLTRLNRYALQTLWGLLSSLLLLLWDYLPPNLNIPNVENRHVFHRLQNTLDPQRHVTHHASKAILQVCFMARENIELSTAVLLDTGCSQHIFRDERAFENLNFYSPGEATRQISGIGNTILKPTGVGDVTLNLCVQGKPRTLTLTNCLFCPELGANLVSGSQLIDHDADIFLSKQGADIWFESTVVAHCFQQNGVFLFHTWTDQEIAIAVPAYSSSTNPAERLWHERLGHLGLRNLRRLKNLGANIDLTHVPNINNCTCEACLLGRMTDVPHKESLVTKETKPYEVIFSDFEGPLPIVGHEGSKYFVSFQCGVTRESQIYMLRYKSEIPSAYRRYKASKERPEDGRIIRRLHTDGAQEYLGHAFQEGLSLDGTSFSYSTAYSQQQNGQAERLNRTLLDKASAMMKACELPPSYWPEAAKHANFLRNISPVASLPHLTSPYEATTGKIFDYEHIRKFGCDVWYRQGSQVKYKTLLDDKGIAGTFVGFDSPHIIRIRNKATGKLIRSSVVHFSELTSEIPGGTKRHCCCHNIAHANDDSQFDLDGEDNDDLYLPARTSSWTEFDQPSRKTRHLQLQTRVRNKGAEGAIKSHIKRTRQTSPSSPSPAKKSRRSERLKDGPQLPSRYQHNNRAQQAFVLGLSAVTSLINSPSSTSKIAFACLAEHLLPLYEPKSWKEAIQAINSKEWIDAAIEEMKSLVSNHTWTLVARPPDRKVLQARWVFRYKRNSQHQIIRHKARWVVKGFEQTMGIDYNETFASVVKPMSYKTLFALAAANDWEIEQMDVKTAFLYGSVDEDIYVEQPEGFISSDSSKVCKLSKALYGLKQSPRVWYDLLSSYLQLHGFDPLDADESVFVNGSTYIAVYVDDLLIFGPDAGFIDTVKKLLNKRFQMTDLGPAAFYLGMEVKRDRAARKLRLSQSSYLEEGIRKMDLWDSPAQLTPLSASIRLTPADKGYIATPAFKLQYQSAVGTLMYAMLGTRPDIAFATSLVSRFASNPTEEHMRVVKRIFSYLRGTLDLHLVYQGDLQHLTGFTDSDWAGDYTRRSTSGFVFNIGSGAISWSAKRQSTVALSTCEAEYGGQTLAAKEAIWLRQLLKELCPEDDAIYATILYADNQGAIALAKDAKFHARTKHIDIQHHWIREKIAAGDIELEYIETTRQIADGFTKPLPKDAFFRFRSALGLEKY